MVGISFVAGLIAFVIVGISGTKSQLAAQAAVPSPAASTPTPDDSGPRLEALQQGMADGCRYDISTRFSKYASKPAAVKTVKPATIVGKNVSMRLKAGGVEFNCSASDTSQDIKVQVADPTQAKKVEAAQQAYNANLTRAAAAEEARRADAAAKAEQQAADAQARQEACGGVQLVVESWNWNMDGDFVHGTGEVTNVSTSPLKNIEASLSIYTSDDTFIKDASGIIKYNPILPGQTSSFEVIDTANPEMKNAKLKLNELFGSEITSMDRKRYDTTCA